MPEYDHNNLVDAQGDASPNLIEVASSVDELISGTPGYFVRHGTVIVFIILCFVISGMYFIRYPDTLEGSTTLTTDPLPIHLKSSSGGRILKLFITEGETVEKNMPIIELENNTGYSTVHDLSNIADSILNALERKDMIKLSAIIHAPMQSLGEGQVIYNSIVDGISAYVLEQKEHIYHKRTENLQLQSARYQSISSISRKERAMITDELKQADERFLSNEKLFKDKVISRQEYYEEAAKLRQKKLALEQQTRAGLQSNITIADNRKQLLDIQYEQQEKENTQINTIREQIRNLQNFVQTWQLKYLILAPYAGSMHFTRPLQANETIAAGEEIGAVMPSTFHYTAYINIPAQGSGKIHSGQKAHLMLDQFPYNEYGYLEGTVRGIDVLPQNNKIGITYQVSVLLPSTLYTSHHRQLPFSGEMTGTARIITNDRNLLERIVSGVSAMDR